MTRWSWAALGAAVFLGGRLSAGGAPDPHWSARNGEDWRAWPPAERTAYTEGFLAGAALGQAWAADSVGLDTTMAGLRRSNGFRLPFGTNVYLSRVNDYYWWVDRRPRPIWYAFWEVNSTLIGPTNDPAR